MIRQILFQHLYGRYDLIGLVERQKYDPVKPYSASRFSISPSASSSIPTPTPKKVAGVKVFIPERMRNDLDVLAAGKYQTISEYVRLVILNHLFGVLHSSGIKSVAPGDFGEGVE